MCHPCQCCIAISPAGARPSLGRTQEGAGEDPLLLGAFGAAFTRGMQARRGGEGPPEFLALVRYQATPSRVLAQEGDDPRYLFTATTLKHFAVSQASNGAHRYPFIHDPEPFAPMQAYSLEAS